MSGEIGEARFPIRPFNGNKIMIIKAFREFITAKTHDPDASYKRKRELEAEIAVQEERLRSMKDDLRRIELNDLNHEDPYHFSNIVDDVCDQEGISSRARGFLINCPTGGLKELKDAVELMVATGDITGTNNNNLAFRDRDALA